MSASKTAIFTLAGIIVTPIAALLALMSSAAGFGSYFFADVLFPYAMLLAPSTNQITASVCVLALAQFPLYGAVTGIAKNARLWILLLVAAHLFAAGACSVKLDLARSPFTMRV